MKKNIQDILYEEKTECCGCGLCYAVCSVGAITMQEDIQGFLYPNVNDALCICCKKCINSCIMKH